MNPLTQTAACTDERPFAVYVHWPFCLSKCPYCDFNSHVHERIDHEAWKDAYLREIDYYAALTQGRTVSSIFFGGGTPSLMKPDVTQAVIDRITARWKLSKDCEITLEANPTSVESDKFRAFAQAGVNRVSVGIQALNDGDLKKLGRTHSADEGRRAIDIAAATFRRFSFDLIYARPAQTLAQWEEELAQALSLAGDHLSLYQLTIEPGTAFQTLYNRGEIVIPGDALAADFYEMTARITEESGLPAYEISNHARPGEESRHNLVYWRYGDYAGIGPGAHGRLTLDGTKHATRAHRAPDIWLSLVREHGHGAHPFEDIAPDNRAAEALMMGLRLREGVSTESIAREAGRKFEDFIAPEKIATLEKEGLLKSFENRLAATPEGFLKLNAVIAYLLTKT